IHCIQTTADGGYESSLKTVIPEACMCQSRTPLAESTRPTSARSSSLCLRPKRMAWEWDSRSAARSLNLTTAVSGHRQSPGVGLYSISYCRRMATRADMREQSKREATVYVVYDDEDVRE